MLQQLQRAAAGVVGSAVVLGAGNSTRQQHATSLLLRALAAAGGGSSNTALHTLTAALVPSLMQQRTHQCSSSSSRSFIARHHQHLSSSSSSSNCLHNLWRRYAADAAAPPPRLGRQRRRLGGSGSSSSSSSSSSSGGRQPPHQQQQQQQQDRWQAGQQQQQQQRGGRHRWQPPLGLTDLQLGRQPALCVATEALRAPTYIEDYDPFQDRSRAAMQPRQVDGSWGDDIEDILLLRQQLENSALPNELKRSRLISEAWQDVLLQVKRTVKVTKGGKVETLRALVAVGNGGGLLGVGEHSGKNIQKVMMDAQLKAYRNITPIPRYRRHTVYHPIDYTHRKIRMRVWPRTSGSGVTASPLMTTLCDLVGIHDVTIKLDGRRKNVANAVKTFVDAMSSQSLPHDGVEGSGVYMREVFPGRLYWGLQRGVDLP